MKTTLQIALGTLLLTVAPLHASLDIVPKDGSPTNLVVEDTATGKVLGTFWDRETEQSDYGFESSIVPDFQWSADRAYVAVTAGASRSRAVSLYRVTGDSLKSIEVPMLSADQAAEIDAIDQAAGGTDAVRWQPDGTLLLKFWADGEVKSDNETPKQAAVWADLEVSGDKATIVGTSSMEPSTPPEGMFPDLAPPSGETLASVGGLSALTDYGFDAAGLVGVHPVSGQNPDGSLYEGTVEIRVVNGVVGLEWKIGDSVSHGVGAMVGMTLGVALDDGLAIYRLFGQSEGQSLIGVWSSAGASDVNNEAILIGNADMKQADIAPESLNGTYNSTRKTDGGQLAGRASISGDEIAKSVSWSMGQATAECQALALGEGIAILSPNGISVLEKRGDSLVGGFVGKELKGVQSETLTPAN
jgi:hypothetical protein